MSLQTCKPKSKRGRKSYNVREGYIDPSGLTHIMTVRLLNERIGNFENLAQEIKHTINMNNINRNNLNHDQIDPKIILPDFPAMKTVELIEFSHNLEQIAESILKTFVRPRKQKSE
ncbi:205_t:CDS:2 [Diversispora eburnea]|uniref:205_t:CDS:1 n=1 Tax=Diversispora eburnea TaxID=1213867 RepID=A0A9N8WAT0_9GLOM|nr:205_t:CDS:2 [Diversispora eburnea]